jgi:hypothetical protein
MIRSSLLPNSVELKHEHLKLCVVGQTFSISELKLPYGTEKERRTIAAIVASLLCGSNSPPRTSLNFTFKPQYETGEAWETPLVGTSVFVWDPYNSLDRMPVNCCPNAKCGSKTLSNKGMTEPRLVKTDDGTEQWLSARKWYCPGEKWCQTAFARSVC